MNQVRLKPWEREVYLDLLFTFDELARENQVEYFLSYGTLLGQYRIGVRRNNHSSPEKLGYFFSHLFEMFAKKQKVSLTN